MEVKLKYQWVKDPKRVEWWNSRWDLCGDIDPMVTGMMVMVAEVDGQTMGPEWTEQAVHRAKACGCHECAECRTALEVEALRGLPVAA